MTRTMLRIRVPLNRLYIFPLVAGTTWFVMLAAMLITWLARGMPRYPKQSNPYVAFISDIGAFQLKPLFLVGGTLTSVSFVATVWLVHFSRYDGRMYGIRDAGWKKGFSGAAMLSGVVAGIALTLLAVLDTFRFHEEHAVLLLVCFVGLVVSMVLTTVVYWDQCWWPSSFRRLRVYCIASAVTVLLDMCLGIAMYGFMNAEYYRVAGVLEWMMAFTGAFYLWAFIGFVSVPEDGIDADERRALLRRASQEAVGRPSTGQ